MVSTYAKILYVLTAVAAAVLLIPFFIRLGHDVSEGEETVLPDDAQGIPGATVEMVTLVPFDGIQAILQPRFVTAEEARAWMDPTEKVLGISIGGEHHAYPISVLSRHEIVNDVVGGQPVAVTW